MATDPRPKVEQELLATALDSPDKIRRFLEYEVRQLLRQLRTLVNSHAQYTFVQVVDAVPTDELLDPFGKAPPPDGATVYCTADGKLYLRNGGTWGSIT